MAITRNVLCSLPYEFGLSQEILAGIQGHAARANPPLQFHFTSHKDDLKELVEERLIEGMISFGLGRFQKKVGIPEDFPVINVSAFYQASPYPLVVNDDHEAGRQVGLHLVKARPARGVYVAPPFGHQYRLRGEGAMACFQQAGIPLAEYRLPDGEGGSFYRRLVYQREVLDKEVPEILDPVGGFPLAVICGDYRVAEMLQYKAREMGLDVPEQVRIAAIGNPTDRVSFLQQPGITHCPLQWNEIGRVAAGRICDWILNGKRPVDRAAIAPGELVIMASSRVRTDSIVEQTRHFIGEREDFALTLGEIATHFGISVGTLINRFQRECGHRPKEMINRWRMEYAISLLRNSHDDIAAIASKCGYADHSTFTTAFRKHTGEAPSRWRMRR